MQKTYSVGEDMMGNKHKDEQNTGNGLHNTLAAGTTVKGNIVTETDFRLDGNVEGDIQCNGKLVIGAKGAVQGNIICDNAEIHGSLIGTIHVNSKLVLKATAHLQGDVTTQLLEIEPSAQFNGTCTMGGNEE